MIPRFSIIREGNAAGGETEAGAASRALLAGGLVQIIYLLFLFSFPNWDRKSWRTTGFSLLDSV